MKKIKNGVIYFLLLLFSLIWISPFYIMVTNAFKTKRELFSDLLALPGSLNFENFAKAFEQMDFLTTLFNSLFITVGSVTVIVFFSALAAYALQRTKTKISGILLFVFISAMLIPFQTIMIPLITLMGRLNLTGSRLGLIFMYLAFGANMSIFLFHGALKAIPDSMDEAALIDGCNPLQTFALIIFPMLKSMIVTVGVLNTIWIWNDYLLPSLTINKPGLQTIPIKMFYFFGQYTKQWHLAMAGLTLAIIPVIIFYLFAQKQIIKGVTDGAVK